MPRFTRAALLFTSAILVVSACERVADVTRPALSPARADAALIAGNPHFFFLKPIANRSPTTGELDATLSPVVEICVWRANACDLPLVSRLSNVRLRGADVDDDADDAQVEAEPRAHYGVKWKTRGLNLDPAKTYRIRVLVAGTELGVADVDVVRNEREARRVDRSQFVPLVAGKSLKIRFRIERGAVTVIGTAGGRVSSEGGGAQLDVPAGALARDVGITVQQATGAALPGGFVLAGTTFDFGPNGLAFASPARLTIAYNDANLSAGREEHELKLMHFVNGAWQVVAGSVVNAQANTVTGPITGFSQYAVGGGSVVTLTGTGSPTIDGVAGAAEWAGAGCTTFPANLPTGGTTPATLCVMNDVGSLYVSVTYAQAVASGDNILQLEFDNLDDGRTLGDDAIVTQGSYGNGPLQVVFADGYLESIPPPFCFSTDGLCYRLDTGDGGTSDGNSTFTNANGVSTFEAGHPLNTTDNTHDFSAGPNSVVGFSLTLVIGGFPTTTTWPSGMDHGHVLISGPPATPLTAFGTATIDGSFAPGEWDLAAKVNFTVNIPPAGNVPATLYVMNDGANLYVAVLYGHAVPRSGVRWGLFFDADDDGIDDPGEDRLVGGIESGTQTFQDQFTSTACGSDKCSDVQGGGTDDGAQALVFHGTHYILEVSHPLNSGDAKDFVLQTGSIFGMRFGLFIFDEPPNDNGFLTQFPGASSYIRVQIQ